MLKYHCKMQYGGPNIFLVLIWLFDWNLVFVCFRIVHYTYELVFHKLNMAVLQSMTKYDFSVDSIENWCWVFLIINYTLAIIIISFHKFNMIDPSISLNLNRDEKTYMPRICSRICLNQKNVSKEWEIVKPVSL